MAKVLVGTTETDIKNIACGDMNLHVIVLTVRQKLEMAINDITNREDEDIIEANIINALDLLKMIK